MRRVVFEFGLMAAMLAAIPSAQSSGPYKVLKVDKVGGDGGFDYVYADVAGRRLYIPRSGQNPRVMVYDPRLCPGDSACRESARHCASRSRTSHCNRDRQHK